MPYALVAELLKIQDIRDLRKTDYFQVGLVTLSDA